MKRGNWGYHLLAIVIVLIWGTTFVSSKVLLQHGLTPHEIFVLRFLLAYVCIWFISPRRLFADTWRDELIMVALGVTGGSLYFLSENIAVGISYVTNVSFIVCTAPLLTTLLGLLFLRDVKASWPLIGGSLIALVGVALVIFNGRFVLKLNPAGDLLALVASLCWAVYSILMKLVTDRYDPVWLTRKVFFYGLLTILPAFIVRPWTFPLRHLAEPVIWGNLLFLGFISSFLCFLLWSVAIKKVDAISISNYVYLNPITTLVTSAIVLNEKMTALAFLGSALILLGVFISNRKMSE